MAIATSVAIASAIAAAASAAASAYSANKAAGVNEKAIAAQRAGETDAAAIERERLAAEQAEADKARRYQEWKVRVDEQARKDWQAFENQRWQDYIRAHQPYWATGQAAYRSLAELAGLPPGASAGGGAPTGTGPSLATIAGGAMPATGAMPTAGASALPTAATSVAGAPAAATPTRQSYLAQVRARARAAPGMPQVSKAPMSLADIAQLASMSRGTSGVLPSRNIGMGTTLR